MSTRWERWWAGSGRKSNATRPGVRPGLETLEGRLVPASPVGVNPVTSGIVLVGSSQAGAFTGLQTVCLDVVRQGNPVMGYSLVLTPEARSYGYDLAGGTGLVSSSIPVELKNIPEAQTLELSVLTGLRYWDGKGDIKFQPVTNGLEMNLRIAGEDLRIGAKTDQAPAVQNWVIRRDVTPGVSDGGDRTRAIEASIGTGGVLNRFTKNGAPNGVYCFTGLWSTRGNSVNPVGIGDGQIRDSVPVTFFFAMGTGGKVSLGKAVSWGSDPVTRPVVAVAAKFEAVEAPSPGVNDFVRVRLEFSDPVSVVGVAPVLPILVDGKLRTFRIEIGPFAPPPNTNFLWYKLVPTAQDKVADSIQLGKSLLQQGAGSLVSSRGRVPVIASLPERNLGQDVPSLVKVALVSTDITRDTTWKQGKVYVIEGEVHVRSGVTLTIEDGVTVLIRNGYRVVRTIDTSALVFESGSRMSAKTVYFGAADSLNRKTLMAGNGGVFFCGGTTSGSQDGISSVKQGTKSLFKADRVVANYLGRPDPLGGDGDDNDRDDIDGVTLIGLGSSEWQVGEVETRFAGDDGIGLTNSTVRMDRLIITYPTEDGINSTSSNLEVRMYSTVVMGLSNEADRELFDLEVDDGPTKVVFSKDCVGDFRGYWGNIYDEVRLSSRDMPQPPRKGGPSVFYVYYGVMKSGPSFVYSNLAD